MNWDKARWFVKSMGLDYWLLNSPLDRDWDREINVLLDNGFRFSGTNSYHAQLGGYKLWIENHPFASFRPEGSFRFGQVRPRRITLARAWEQLKKDRKNWGSASPYFGYPANNIGPFIPSQQQQINLTSFGMGAALAHQVESSPTVASDLKDLEESISTLRNVEGAHISRPMPDHITTLTGWRGWQVNKDGLVALGLDYVWESKKVVAATCSSGYDHRSPERNCTCGYWSFKSIDLLQEALKPYVKSVVVVGSVELWGRVIECENGYRSEFAYPKELWLLKPDLDFLSWTYGVPVRKLIEK